MHDDVLVPKSPLEVIRNFTPIWYAVTMGTGVVSILFMSFPYGQGTDLMRIFSLVFFFLNLALFILFTFLSVARYWMYPSLWTLVLNHPVSSLYLSCCPMSAATLINVAAGLIHREYNFGGRPFLYFLWGAWWVEIGMSAMCCWGIVHLMVVNQSHSLECMTTIWLLPVVTLVVSSSTGAVLAQVLTKYSTLHALVTAAASIFLVTVGLTLVLMMLTIYLLRLILFGLPQGGFTMSVFMPLGPTGQSGYTILLIGQSLKTIIPLKFGNAEFLHSGNAGETIHVVCTCIAFVMWSLASMWILYALLAITHAARHGPLTFRLSFWGLVFPNGVYANFTIGLSTIFDSRFFRIYGAICAIATMVLWSFCVVNTVALMRDGTIFEAPALENVDLAQLARQTKTFHFHIPYIPRRKESNKSPA